MSFLSILVSGGIEFDYSFPLDVSGGTLRATNAKLGPTQHDQ
jgi:hypothetical protein